MDEEVVVLEEQLAAAHADVERFEALLADAEAKLAGRDGEVGELRHQIEGALAERQEREPESESLQAALDEARTASRAAVARYRDVVLAHEPELPAELVGGDSVEAVDESLERARQTVAQVRQHLEQQAQAQRVPPGAPVRSPADMSDLSATEKIRLGLQLA